MADLLTACDTAVDLPKVTAGMIRNWMAEQFSEANGYACIFEVANGTGHTARRSADAVVVNLWPSRGMEIVGYEHKVSRSDWLHELKQPEKAWPVMQYCDRWILLAAPGVAKAEEVPINWGWQEFDGQKLRARKAAPALTPKALDRTFVASMLRRPVRDVESMIKRKLDESRAALEKEFDERLERKLSARMSRADEVMKKVTEIKDATGIDLTSWSPATERIAAALKFAMSADPFGRFGGLVGSVRDVQGALTSLQELQEQLAEFMPAESMLPQNRRGAKG